MAHVPQKSVFCWNMAVDFQTVLWSAHDNPREITTGDHGHTNHECRPAWVDILVVRGVDAGRRDADEVTILGHTRQWESFLLEYFGHGTGSVVLPYFACRRGMRRWWLACHGGRGRTSNFAPTQDERG